MKILVQKFFYIFLYIILILVISCNDVPTGVSTNQPPNTFLSLFPDSTISPQKTKIKITWWGDDPDGLVKGFYISFDSTNWTYTTNNDSTFLLAINGSDSTFRLWVSAVDDKGLTDPTPATNKYPVYNSSPSVSFDIETELPDTSFTVATFIWTGTDPDGDNTIKYYYWALNDTNTWNTVNGSTKTLTIRQINGLLLNSNNKFYLKAQDIAGTFSKTITMPDTSKTWFVRKPEGNFLLIDDYPASILDNTQAAQFYQSAFDTVYSILDIKIGNKANVPKVNTMFIETLNLFKCVVWYGGKALAVSDNTNFDLAQETLPYYMASGGKVFFTTSFPTTLDGSIHVEDFAPVDSVSAFSAANLNFMSTIVIDNFYPVLTAGSPSPDGVRGMYPKPGGHIIYRAPVTPTYSNDSIIVCVKNTVSNPNIVFMTMQLHRMNSTGTAIDFFRKIINTDFGL